MKTFIKSFVITSILLIAFVNAVYAAPHIGGDDHETGAVRTIQKVYYGTILEMRSVNIHETPKTGYNQHLNVGSAIGAAIGGAVVANNSNSYALTGVGALVGGVLGNEAYESMKTPQQGVEAVIQLKDGSVLAMTQGISGSNFSAGDKVVITVTGNTVRVFKSTI